MVVVIVGWLLRGWLLCRLLPFTRKTKDFSRCMFSSDIYISGTALCEWRETIITEVRFYNKFQTFQTFPCYCIFV